MNHIICLFLLIFVCFADAKVALSEEISQPSVGTSTGMILPRFASLKSDNVYVRTGPSMDYPIKWIYKRDGLPVEIEQEFDSWRKIKTYDGNVGWVHKILLSGNRFAIITAENGGIAYTDTDLISPVVKFERGVVVNVTECERMVCRVTFSPYAGWIDKKSLWGVYGSEIFN